MVNFALIVNNVVKHVFSYDESRAVGEKWIAAMRSDVKIIKVSGYSFENGDTIINGVFYRKNSSGNLEALQQNNNIDENVVRYAGIIDDEVIGGIIITKSLLGQDNFDRFDQAINSSYLISECPLDVNVGWTYDGINFNLPEG